MASLAVVVDTTQTIPGGDSGTITIWTYVYESESDTLDTFRAIYEFAADGYADSVGTYNDIVAAAGTVWMEYREEEMYDGGEVAPAGTGTMIGEYFLDHVDFASFSVSTDSENQAASGYMTFTEDYDYSVGDTVHWEYTSLADVAMADYSGTTVYAGLLGASSTLAYDGSETSWVGVGTICLDSEDAEIPFDGCFDLDLNLIWAGDSNGEMPTTFPAGGTMEISASALDTTTIEAAALYDFTDTTLDPYCYWLSWDADGDGEYDDWGPEEICIP